MHWHHFRDTVELEDLHEYGYQSMFAQVERGAMVSIVTMIHDVSWMCHVLVYSLCTMLANPFGLHIHDSLVELLTLIPNSTREGRKTKAMQKLYKLTRYTIMHTIIRYFRVCRKQKRIPSHEHSRDSMLNVGHKF